jgi:hypothetical protein
METAGVDVRRYDKTAIVRCVQRSRATWRGRDMSLAVRLSQVWIWRPAGWQLVAIQFSTLGSGWTARTAFAPAAADESVNTAGLDGAVAAAVAGRRGGRGVSRGGTA